MSRFPYRRGARAVGRADISEIMVNGPEHVFIERQGHLEPMPGLPGSSKHADSGNVNDGTMCRGARLFRAQPPQRRHSVTNVLLFDLLKIQGNPN